MNDKVMRAGPYIVVHLEDPPGSGRAACNGMLFESAYSLALKGTTLWACTGCTVLAERVRYWRKKAGTAVDLQATFDLRWKADMRAIKRWQAAHPGKELVWPDHA